MVLAMLLGAVLIGGAFALKSIVAVALAVVVVVLGITLLGLI